MIRINLLQQKKRSSVSVSEAKGNTVILIGFAAVLVVAAGVFFLVDMPTRSAIAEFEGQNRKLQHRIDDLNKQTKDFSDVKKALDAAQALEASISKLDEARATPAYMLTELSTILTKNKRPTMTDDMAKRVASDPNRRLAPWDPKHVWIEDLDEKEGKMTIHGGAETAADATQFALRLQASVYFADVIPEVTSGTADQANKPSYYRFTITGKVNY